MTKQRLKRFNEPSPGKRMSPVEATDKVTNWLTGWLTDWPQVGMDWRCPAPPPFKQRLPGQPPPRKMAKFGKCVGVIAGNEQAWISIAQSQRQDSDSTTGSGPPTNCTWISRHSRKLCGLGNVKSGRDWWLSMPMTYGQSLRARQAGGPGKSIHLCGTFDCSSLWLSGWLPSAPLPWAIAGLWFWLLIFPCRNK